MPLDTYSPCPGGEGKKIRFCCPDLAGELQGIERMLEGDQLHAAIEKINRLEAQFPGRACLKATKALLLRVLNRIEEAKPYVADFVRLHPDNPIAWAEQALITAATDGGRAAMEPLQKALGYCGGEILDRVYEMLGMVAGVLALEGEYLAARSLFATQTLLDRNDTRPVEMLVELNASAVIPLWVKDDRRPSEGDLDPAWREEYAQALAPAQHAQWSEAEKNLVELAKKIGDVPAVWRSLTTLRGWLADRPGAIEAARKFASLNVPLEDAAEAEAFALFLADNPLGDDVDELELEYAVRDVEQVEILLASSPYLAALAVNPAALVEEGQPPPKAAWSIFDRVVPASAADLNLETVPRQVCRMLLFGRQTDREPRLEVTDVNRPDLQQVKDRIAQTAGPHLGEITREEVVGQTPQTIIMLARNWRVPAGTTRQHIQELTGQHEREMLLGRWPKLPLGILDGKTPEEAAGEERFRGRLLGIILLIEFWMERTGSRFDFNDLRSRLGLPTQGPMEPGQVPLQDIPMARLARVVVDKVSEEDLLAGFRRAVGFRASAAIAKFARAIVERPSLASRPERISALSILVRLEEDSDRALAYLEEGRKATLAARRPCTPWDFLELPIRLGRGEAAEASRLVQHIATQHINEPGVAESLQRFLIEIGAIRPDGTPVERPARGAAEEPGIVVPGVPGSEPGKLWTPDSAPQSGEKPKIWMPGMD